MLAALLALTALFGRPFSRLAVPGAPVYVSEVALAAALFLALRRCGVSGALARVRSAVPVLALLVLWLAGAVATLRGLHGSGLQSVLHDIGLVEYSVLVPLLAIVVDTRERALLFLRALLYAGLGATLVAWVVFVFFPGSVLGGVHNPGSAVGIYMALFVVFFAARAFHGGPVRLPEIVVLELALVLMLLIAVKSIPIALAAALVCSLALLPAGRRLYALAATAAAVGVAYAGAALVEAAPLERLRLVGASGVSAAPAATAVADPNFVADDAMTALGRGRPARDAIEGRISRELRRREPLELAALVGLQPGKTYTVLFSVKPLARRVTIGAVGNTAGLGWGTETWVAAPRPVWQQFRKTLTATQPRERLVLMAYSGAPRIRIDGLRVLRGRHTGPTGDFLLGPTVAPSFSARDDAAPLLGGRRVSGDAATGRLSREVKRREPLVLPVLEALVPGKTYTVQFSVKPLTRKVTIGAVGNTSGRGWGAKVWITAPAKKWQQFRKTLRATQASDRLGFITYRGATRVRFDDIKVSRRGRAGPDAGAGAAEKPGEARSRGGRDGPGRPARQPPPTAPRGTVISEPPGPSGRLLKQYPRGTSQSTTTIRSSALVWGGQRFQNAKAFRSWLSARGGKWNEFVQRHGKAAQALQQRPAPRPSAERPATPNRDGGVAVVADVRSAFEPETTASRNVRWRLEYWKYLLRKSAENPLIGVGFGHPAAFRWKGKVFDTRSADPTDPRRFSSPHNSFVNLLYRTGLLAVIPLLVLVAVGIRGTVVAVRSADAASPARPWLVGTLAIFAFTVVIASFNVALEGPFMGIFFWSALALLLVLPRLLGGPADERASRPA